jgi:tetratricopeptide (TPR) repeat protein
VIEREWSDDFGEARNHVLEECRDARYVLWIDADERLECPDPEQTRRYLATYAAEHPALNIEITNLESDGSELYRFVTVRLFRATGTEFRGALHEAVHLVDDTKPLNGHRFDQIRLDHYGYAKDVVLERNKARRNLEIAEAQHEADSDARSAIHLARSLSYADETPERALELLEASIADAEDSSTEGQIMALMADRCLQLTDNRRAFDLAEQALRRLPGDDTALGVVATASGRLGNHAEFIVVAEAIADGTASQQTVKIDHNRLVFADHLVAAYSHTGQAERAVEQAFALLAEAGDAMTSWPALIECLNKHYGGAAVELLAALALQDTAGGFLEPVIKTYPSGTVANFCAAYVAAGGSILEATRVGLHAAAMSSNDNAFEMIAPAASDLDPFVRVGLADRIASSGRPDLAEKLRTEPVVLKL